MVAFSEDNEDRRGVSLWLVILAAALVGVPAIIVRLEGGHAFGTVADTAIFGLAIGAAALLLAWAAEAAEVDVS